jgi:cysteine desulfurase/selenocysteine lyase
VLEAVKMAFCEVGANPGRGGHAMGLEAGRYVLAARQQLGKLLNVDASRIVFTKNTTEALNLALFGSLKPGARVVTGAMEHNSVLRPLEALKCRGVEVELVPAPGGKLDLETLKRALTEDTTMLVLSHVSNVTGAVAPLLEAAELAKEAGALVLADLAQSLGYLPLNLGELPVDLAAFPGHKGLLGPMGTGGLYLRPGLELEPLLYGGTGSFSDSPFQPKVLPDRYESGTPNLPGIMGLGAAVEFILEHGQEITAKSLALAQRFRDSIAALPKVKIFGPEKLAVPLVSVNFAEEASEEVAIILSEFFQIAVRGGLHCAPLAHRTLGTGQQGTVRFSFGYGNTEQDVEAAFCAAKAICQKL